MTPQSSFMIVVPIIRNQREALQVLLDSMNVSAGTADKDNTVIPFAQFDRLHTARLLIIESNTAEDIKTYGWQPYDWPASLAFLGDVDGTEEDFLAHVAIYADEGLSRLYQHCEGYSAHSGSMLTYLQKHSTHPAASYVNWAGRTTVQVHEEAMLQASLSARLESIKDSNDREDVRKIRQQLLTHVQQELHVKRLSLTPESQTPWRYRARNTLDLIGFPIILLLLSPILLIIAPWVLWCLRIVEKYDPDIDIRPDTEHISQLSFIEDHDVSNQFNVFGDVKPGRFRYWILKSVMRVVDYAARHVYRRGFLARVRTIHFARWVFLNDNRSMFFASVYDGSLESYMDDFINKVAFGLNLTFSHGVGFPRTRWMLKGGAELEQPFKDTLRRHQLPSAVWYRAHPGLTAFDMARNARIRHGVEHYPRNDHAIRQWLSEI